MITAIEGPATARVRDAACGGYGAGHDQVDVRRFRLWVDGQPGCLAFLCRGCLAALRLARMDWRPETDA